MKLLTLKATLVRYACAVIFILLAGVIPNSAGLFLVIPVAIVSIKFLIYDGIVAALKSKLPTLRVSPWFLTGYGLTVGGDMIYVYGATRDEVDAGFAFFGTFLFTPWILGIAVVAMLFATYLNRKK